MAANQIIGQIASIGPVQSLMAKNGNAFQKRDLVINVRRFDPNTGEPVTDWENTPKLSFMGDKCRDLDRFQVGQMGLSPSTSRDASTPPPTERQTSSPKLAPIR